MSWWVSGFPALLVNLYALISSSNSLWPFDLNQLINSEPETRKKFVTVHDGTIIVETKFCLVSGSKLIDCTN